MLLPVSALACVDVGHGGAAVARDTAGAAATPAGAASDGRPARAAPRSRTASALHVVRAPASPRNALEPLPESLAVELFDARGRPAGGATVLWRVVAGGGRVSPDRSTTDSAGHAAASWTPGPSADLQTVAVEAPGAGAVELHALVPAAAVSASPRAVSLWPGDGAQLRAVLADAAGHALTGGAVRWESDDSAVARVGAASGTVVAVGAGTTRIVAYATGGIASAPVAVTVLPVVAGRVVTLDGAPVSRAAVVVRAGGDVDSVATDAAGRFAQRLRKAPDDTVDVAVAAPAPFRAARLRIRDAHELGDLRVLLLPDVWTVTSGSFQGERVDVSAVAATARAEDGTRFWRLQRVLPLATWAGVGWPADQLPVAVTFRRNEGDGSISPADSDGFWRGARTLERELGMSLFEPSSPQPGDDEAERPVIQVLVDPSINTAGYTFASWNGEGVVGSAEVRVRSSALLRDEDVVVHELMHALGFGHTSSWPSIMSNAPGRADRLTASDVAHAQLLFRLRSAARTLGTPYGIVESAAAERTSGRTSAPPRRDRPALPMKRRQ